MKFGTMIDIIKVKTMFLTVTSLALAVTTLCADGRSAWAVTYECSPTQAFTWKHGKLESIPTKTLRDHFRFDDESGDMLYAALPSSPFIPSHLDIVQNMKPGDDLIALDSGVINGHFTGNEALRIRSWDSEAGLTYLLTSSEVTSAGQCRKLSAEQQQYQ